MIVLAMDDAEKIETFRAWVAKTGSKDRAPAFAYSPPEAGVSGNLYEVTGIPTQCAIDASDVGRASFALYGGPTDELEKAVRAALGSP